MLILILIAFITIFVGVILIMLGSIKSKEGKVEGGGVIIVGPLPIVIGTSERVSKILIVLAIILTLVVLIYFIIASRILGFSTPK